MSDRFARYHFLWRYIPKTHSSTFTGCGDANERLAAF